MATLTRNLFYGSDDSSFDLSVSGEWPRDMEGHVFNIGPDRRNPGDHWFAGQGLLCRIQCAPTSAGEIRVDFGRIETPLSRIRSQLPELFKVNGVAEVSPFGFSNFANTNVQWMDDRLFIGYDVGRPVEADPVSLEFVSPVGANREWLHTLPAPVEPMTGVAAHPGPAWDENALYFVNYEVLALGPERGFRVCRWDLEGELESWSLRGIGPFDTVHDIKVCRDYLVISDLPFIGGPDAGPTQPRRAVADCTNIWIVSKEDLRKTPTGGDVPFRHLSIPMMGGHMALDYDNRGSEICLYVTHHPMADLAMGVRLDDRVHGSGVAFDPDYEGLIPAAVQPVGVGRYRIDANTGKLLDRTVTARPEIFWGGLLFTQNLFSDASRNSVQNLWLTSLGFDAELISERWWQIYAETFDNVFVAPRDFPQTAIPGALVRFDTDQMDIVDSYAYPLGTFPHPATFVPRVASQSDTDGYVLVTVHRDGAKAIDVFDAAKLAAGPIASASTPNFNCPMLLHSTWAPARTGPRRSTYSVDVEADAWWTMNDFAESSAPSVGIARAMFDSSPSNARKDVG